MGGLCRIGVAGVPRPPSYGKSRTARFFQALFPPRSGVTAREPDVRQVLEFFHAHSEGKHGQKSQHGSSGSGDFSGGASALAPSDSKPDPRERRAAKADSQLASLSFESRSPRAATAHGRNRPRAEVNPGNPFQESDWGIFSTRQDALHRTRRLQAQAQTRTASKRKGLVRGRGRRGFDARSYG